MKLLITVFYNSEQGGLHDNVFSTAIEAKNRGYNVYVACRSGIFQDKLKSNNINVVEINQQKKIWSVNNIIKNVGTDIDLIHAHPGISREIAVLLRDEFEIPIIYHVHGIWTDNISHYIHKLDSVFAVSESVRQRITDYSKSYSHLVQVIPNYSDYELSEKTVENVIKDHIVLTLMSRLEYDKKLIIDEVKKLDGFLNETKKYIIFNIIGDGSLKNELKMYFNDKVNNANVKINFKGWISDKEEIYSNILNSDLVIGPGRVAIDAHKLGIPVIVVGSQNYYGVINRKNWQEFVSSNFGGVGPKPKVKTSIEKDIDDLLNNKDIYLNSSSVGQNVVNTFFDKDKTLEKMFNIYDIILQKNS